jgi:hypothetical protein
MQRPGEKPTWASLAQRITTKSTIQIAHRWKVVLDPKLTKGSWTIDEDTAIINWVEQKGPQNWNTLTSMILRQRTGKQCRERWFNVLNPDGHAGSWTAEEDQIIINMQKNVGNKWALISKSLKGRKENHVKNRWYSTLSKRISRLQRGQEPIMKRGRRSSKLNEPESSAESANITRTKVECISPQFQRPCDELFEVDFAELTEETSNADELFSELFSAHGFDSFSSFPHSYQSLCGSSCDSPSLSGRCALD